MGNSVAAGGEAGEPVQDESGAAEEQDLQAGLGGLAGLVSDSVPLEALLKQVATFAVRAIPGADGAGVTLLLADRADDQVQALAASAPFVSEIDAIQYEVLHEGPCITAALEGRTVRSGSLGGDKQWPRFGPRVSRLGVHSVLSLPLLLPSGVVGAINVYAHPKDVFDDRAAELGGLFAAPAAVAVHNAQVLARAQQVAAELQRALASRAVIDQAIGILLSRSGGTADDAFARLRSMSQSQNQKLAVIAEHLVAEAVRRASARHTQP